eukprot:COSAG01_NODE_40585_length_462_cov_0.509642_1_plen_71_part_01
MERAESGEGEEGGAERVLALVVVVVVVKLLLWLVLWLVLDANRAPRSLHLASSVGPSRSERPLASRAARRL